MFKIVENSKLTFPSTYLETLALRWISELKLVMLTGIEATWSFTKGSKSYYWPRNNLDGSCESATSVKRGMSAIDPWVHNDVRYTSLTAACGYWSFSTSKPNQTRRLATGSTWGNVQNDFQIYHKNYHQTMIKVIDNTTGHGGRNETKLITMWQTNDSNGLWRGVRIIFDLTIAYRCLLFSVSAVHRVRVFLIWARIG